MAGIYFHIPFCKTICPYCDFHKSGSLELKPAMLAAIKTELFLQKNYLDGQAIESIYFGGGTPSLLTASEIDDLLNIVVKNYELNRDAEISLEANPDDLDENYLKELSKTAINRLSIGCQSFVDNDLEFLQRRHSSKQSELAIIEAKNADFKNLSIDLIYGLQNQTNESWLKTIQKALDLEIQHISAYHLTIEPKTKFALYLKRGQINEIDEEVSNALFETLIDMTHDEGFIHYEISSFGKPDYFSIHNSNYWKQKIYLGIGPSAHSYNGNRRQWNISNNRMYIEKIDTKQPYYEVETLSYSDKYNDYVLTALRTMWGIDLEYLENQYSKELLDYCMNMAGKFIDYGLLKLKNKNLIVTDQGKFVSDNIISELLFVDKETRN